MALSAFDDRDVEPTPEGIRKVLGSAHGSWTALGKWLEASGGVDSWEWGFTGKQYGWGLRARKGKRVIAYLIPRDGAFLVGLVLGDRAMKAVPETPLSEATRAVIAAAKRYGEGTGFRLAVSTAADLEDVRVLVGIKLATG